MAAESGSLSCGTFREASPARRFARFNVVSALGMGVQLLALAALAGPAGIGYLPATAIAVSLAVVHNFAWHWAWTWRDRPRGRPMAALSAFVVANGSVSLVTNLVVMAGLVSGAGIRPVAANLCAIATAGVANFALADRWVFRSRARRSASLPRLGATRSQRLTGLASTGRYGVFAASAAAAPRSSRWRSTQ